MKSFRTCTPVILTDGLYSDLRKWIQKYYVGNLIYDDLFVPSFILRCQDALESLTKLLDMNKLYDFQAIVLWIASYIVCSINLKSIFCYF